MPFISQASINELTERMDAVSIASDYVRLEKRGGRFWACCPFHQEKTASFTVNPEQKTFYCFGCHKGGSLISFVMEMDSLSFPEAIEALAKKSSVELVYESSGDRNSGREEEKKRQRDELFELYQRMSGTFLHFLHNNHDSRAALSYIISRGISKEMVERFRLGYSPDDRYWLYKFLAKKGYSRDFLASSGLFSSRHVEASLFSGRLMFPISDRMGRTIAFGGRYISRGDSVDKDREAPKYINSPESPIYKKRETLYGLDLALPEIKRTKTAYIAEGYTDVIALHQAGISNAVAPLGTAFTDEQAKLLKRWAENLVLFFDTDGAGQEAAHKTIMTARANGFSCSLVSPMDQGEKGDKSMENAKDPADILNFFGSEALQRQAKYTIVDFEYLLKRSGVLFVSGDKGLTSEGKARAMAFLFPYLDLLASELVRNSCIEAAADNFGLLPALAVEEYRLYRQRKALNSTKEVDNSSTYQAKPDAPIRINDELALLLAVAVDFVSAPKENLFPKFRSLLVLDEVEDPNAKEIYIALEECIRYGEISIDDFLARISSSELKKVFLEHSSTGEFSLNPEKFVKEGIIKIKGRHLEKQQNEIIIKLRSIKNIPPGDSESVRELISEKMRIDSELVKLKQGR